MKFVDSVCTYCGVGCDICASVESNNIVSISARKEGAVSEGELCVKGKYGYDFVYSKNRLVKVKVKKSFVDKHLLLIPKEICSELLKLKPCDGYLYPSLEVAYKLVAWKLKSIVSIYGNFSFASIGGARGNCESSYVFQKFTREVINSPHIDNCARVCHAPSLKGMRSVIGEGAATNPFSDIKHSEFIIVMGSNTTEAHPIVANKIIRAKKSGAKLALFDIRKIALSKFADFNLIVPYESNLLIVNMLSYVILKEDLYDKEFVKNRTVGFDEYKKKILSDPYANPEFFQKIYGYEDLTQKIKTVAREYSKRKSLIFWGLGVTEHLDGSYAVSALCNLAIMTGNIGKRGAGLMPLRGQNNVQGTCDMGCLPYYAPDYERPLIEGKKTPDIINAIETGDIKALFNMGEDIAHIHPNQNKIHKALEKLDFLVVNELFDNEITKYADVVFGVKSAYEKSGVYINAERRIHLSQPLVVNDLPDDWEVIQGISKEYGVDFGYENSKDIWDEVQVKAPKRFNGASYEKLTKNRTNGLQWPVNENELPVLHIDNFRTKNKKAIFRYKRYSLRGQISELFYNKRKNFYLSTGRAISMYNNSAQTKESEKLIKRYKEDILLVSDEDIEFFRGKDRVVLKSKYGQCRPLKIKISKNIKKGTLFCTFHHASSGINFLFGDEADELTKTARFKSVKVIVSDE